MKKSENIRRFLSIFSKIMMLMLPQIFMIKPSSGSSSSCSIVAIVGAKPITKKEVLDREHLLHVISGVPKNEESFKQSLAMLVDEAKKISSASKIEIPIIELDKQVEDFAKDRGMTLAEFKTFLKEKGVNIKTLYNRFKALVTWRSLIESNAPKYIPLESEIEEALALHKTNGSKTLYNISEIVCSNENESFRVLRLLDGQPFNVIAIQNSVSSSALKGGDLGFINIDNLPLETKEHIKKLTPGEYTKPIKVGRFYKIFFLKDIDSRESTALSRTKVDIVHIIVPKSDDLHISQELVLISNELKGLTASKAIEKARSHGINIKEEQNISAIKLIEMGKKEFLNKKFQITDMKEATVFSYITNVKSTNRGEYSREMAINDLKQNHISRFEFKIVKQIESCVNIEHKKALTDIAVHSKKDAVAA